MTKDFDKVKYRKAKNDLVPECFFYNCDVPKRIEEIQAFSKVMNNKVVERGFSKETSVFAKWREDTESILG